jgi:hypothetical protein
MTPGGGSPQRAARVLAAIMCSAAAGCGAGPGGSVASQGSSVRGLPADERPLPAGRGRQFRLPAGSPAVAARRPVAGMRCRRGPAGPGAGTYAVHLELYARRLVLPVPAGIGVAPPQRRRGAYVLGGACEYPLRTLEPTGIVLVDASEPGASLPPSLGDLFAVWGQPLSRGQLAGFRGRVLAFVGGRRFGGDPRAIRLRRHAELVLEIGGFVLPHRTYRFPPGL